MERVLVAGISGAGKSTMARRIASILNAPYVELDALYHGPQWVPRPSFVADVEAFVAGPRWVTEWQYNQVRLRMLERADTVIWLDYSRPVVMSRVLRRSALRAALRQPLFNDNRERWRDWLDPEHPIRWAWTHLERKRSESETALSQADHIHLVRLRRPREAHQWLGRLSRNRTDNP